MRTRLGGLLLLSATLVGATADAQQPRPPMGGPGGGMGGAMPGMGGAGPGGMPPGMPDPSAMSGIPRPDPQVAPGRLVVRVIRESFAHPVVGHTVTLEGPMPDGVQHTWQQTTDDQGRAGFEGLTVSATYVARCEAWGTKVSSQPIEMPETSGVKTLLYFKPDESQLIGESDGTARPDARLAAGEVVLSLVDAAGKPMAGVPVTLKATGDSEKAKALPATTDASGGARWSGQPLGAGRYTVAVEKDGLSGTSEPFAFDGSAGMRLGLRALAYTKDATAVRIGGRSHLIAEVRDDEVAVMENFFIENTAGKTYDPGPAGLVFEMPESAHGVEAAGEAPAGMRIDGRRVTLPGPIPPAGKQLPLAFMLPEQAGTVAITQSLPIALEHLTAITDRLPGMEVDGDGLEKTERELQGRKFWLISGPAVPAGGVLRLKLVGLPHPSTWMRNGFVALAAIIGLWGLGVLLAGLGSKSSVSSRASLEAERQRLLDELATLEGAGVAGGGNRREEVAARLEGVYRQLDDSEGAA